MIQDQRIEDDGEPRNAFTGKPYMGGNIDALELAKDERDFQSNLWLTFKQARKLGATVRKGEHGVDLVRYVGKVVQDPNDPSRNKTIGRSVRNFVVFNIDQIDNLPAVLEVQKNEWED